MTTPSQQRSPEVVWSQMAILAQRICDHIERTPPDLIVVLHKSGAVVWQAAEALWRAARWGPLPPHRIRQRPPGEGHLRTSRLGSRRPRTSTGPI